MEHVDFHFTPFSFTFKSSIHGLFFGLHYPRWFIDVKSWSSTRPFEFAAVARNQWPGFCRSFLWRDLGYLFDYCRHRCFFGADPRIPLFWISVSSICSTIDSTGWASNSAKLLKQPEWIFLIIMSLLGPHGVFRRPHRCQPSHRSATNLLPMISL